MSKDWKFILLTFGIWRIVLFFIAFLSTLVIPKWGGWFASAERILIPTGFPSWIWGFGNFDGVHYLSIAQNGYQALGSQAFFPLFPLLTRWLSLIFPKNPSLDLQLFVDPSFFNAAFIISNLLFIAALYSFYKLMRIDFNEKTAKLSVIFLLFYPTSYYFGSIYTESLMLLLATASIYFIRKEKYLLGASLIALASITKVIGVFLLPLLVIELFIFILNKKASIGKLVKGSVSTIIAVSGILSYSIFLYKKYGDPFLFVNVQPSFGQERSALPVILLPQVIYRYWKIFTSVNVFSLSFFNAALEIIFSLGVLGVLVYFIKKMRLSYWIFTFLVLIVPTMTGTFNSMPRYTLMAFLLVPLVVEKVGVKPLRWVLIGFALLQVVLLSMFIRGYWVS